MGMGVGGNRAIIGIDIGTTSTKSVVFTIKGELLGSHSIGYPLLQDQPAWAEQDPETIMRAVAESVKGALDHGGVAGSDVSGVGLSSAMHSLIAVDREGRPLTRSITWADGRSEEQAKRIKEKEGGLAVYRATGVPIHPFSPLTKLAWLKENNAETFAKAHKFVSIKEYVLFRLFGEWVVDYSIASASGLLSLDSLQWNERALELAGIEAGRLSSLQPGTYRLSGMNEGYAEAMGLRADTPFFLGGSDGALANIGVGAIGPGEMAITIGTSAAVRMMTDKPRTDERARTFCYGITDSAYIIGGATNNGAIVLQWLRESLFAPEGRETRDEDYDAMLEEAARVAAGAGGLLFLPYLSGERAPIWNAEARGTFFGAGLFHRREHFIRAGLEGVMLAVLSVAEALKELAGPAREVRASGGFAKSPLWRQMLADMIGQEVLMPRVTEASALGAAAIAMQGLGELGGWSEAKAWIPIDERLAPDARTNETYRELLALYNGLSVELKDRFSEIAALQRKLGHS